ncbi:MAG: hypothetical protein ACT4PZ_24785 [Panacagrimonas sp.]
MNIEQLLSPDLATRNPKGLFLLTAVERAQYGERVLHRLHLADWTGAVTVRDEWEVSTTVVGLRLPIPVCVELQRWDRPEGRSFSLIDVYRAADWEMEPGLELLPADIVPTEALIAFRTLVRFAARLRNPHLKRLVSEVLADPRVSIPFCTLPASESGYHHGYAGGLLVHSTDMLESIAGLLKPICDANHDDVEITQIGYLFHDLGKVRTMIPGATSEARAVRHEIHTIRILRAHVHRLAETDPRSALLLREIFDRCATPARDRKLGGFIGAQTVTYLDGISTQRDRESANDSNFQGRMLGLSHV